MINILLILLIVHYIGLFIFKPNNNLNCGLFGWAGKNPEDFNRDKFDKLGIYNDERGKHSCGTSIDGEIYIGVDGNKLYKDFVITNYDIKPSTYPTVLGHTRYATFGKHTVENAHPFGYGTNKDNGGFDFIGVHNGSLLGHKDLASKYDIDLVIKNGEVTREKIDSEVLLEILFQNENFKVLNEYNGAAALLFTHTSEPNVIYCYHGKSKKEKNDKDSVEERPLFYYKENKNSIYISSMENSLEAIGGTKKTIFSFAYNTVYKITDGDIDNAVKTRIKRTDNYQKNYTTYGYGYTSHSAKDYIKKYNKEIEEADYEDITKKKGTQLALPLSTTNIHREDELINKNDYGSKIYFNKLRYWRNGHLIKGCYMWVPKYGFYYLDEDPKKAEKQFWNYVNKWFYLGDFMMTNNDVDKSQAFIPFVHNNKNELTGPELFYFYKGIRVRTQMDYIFCREYDNTKQEFDEPELSICSTHPIININNKLGVNNQNIILDQRPFTNIICPLGSDNIYNIQNGNCVSIRPIVKQSKTIIKNLSEIEKELDKIVEVENTKTTNLVVISQEKLDKDIETMFFNNYKNFPLYIKRLQKYGNMTKAKNAISVLEKFIAETSTLISIDTNNK